MKQARVGWVLVVIQFGLLLALVLVPTGTAWPMPLPLRLISWALLGVGLGLVVAASLNLGRALTPTPVPNGRSGLRTDGLYRLMRHPIYTGVLSLVAGITLGSRHWLGLALGAITVVFFHLKARWEEHRLAEVFADYGDYAARTPRFVPRLLPGLLPGRLSGQRSGERRS